MRLYSNVACKLHIFFTYYFINLSPTLLVAVSVQRYLAIAKHHYSKRHCTVKNAYTVIGLICLGSLFIQLHWGIFYELKFVPIQQAASSLNRTVLFRRVCNISSSYPTYFWFRSNMLGYIQWFFFTLCPFITMLILNSLILRVIASARRIQQRMNQKNQRKKAKQRNMTIMLLSVSCVFILLTAPASTFMAFGHLFKNLHGPNSQSLWTMFSLIYYANTAANFLLYFLTANVFRQELRVMILSLPGCTKLLSKHCRQSGTMAAAGLGATTTVAHTGKTQTTTRTTLNNATHVDGGKTGNDYQRRNGSSLSTVNSINRPTDRLLVDHPDLKSTATGSNDEDSPLWPTCSPPSGHSCDFWSTHTNSRHISVDTFASFYWLLIWKSFFLLSCLFCISIIKTFSLGKTSWVQNFLLRHSQVMYDQRDLLVILLSRRRGFSLEWAVIIGRTLLIRISSSLEHSDYTCCTPCSVEALLITRQK